MGPIADIRPIHQVITPNLAPYWGTSIYPRHQILIILEERKSFYIFTELSKLKKKLVRTSILAGAEDGKHGKLHVYVVKTQ